MEGAPAAPAAPAAAAAPKASPPAVSALAARDRAALAAAPRPAPAAFAAAAPPAHALAALNSLAAGSGGAVPAVGAASVGVGAGTGGAATATAAGRPTVTPGTSATSISTAPAGTSMGTGTGMGAPNANPPNPNPNPNPTNPALAAVAAYRAQQAQAQMPAGYAAPTAAAGAQVQAPAQAPAQASAQAPAQTQPQAQAQAAVAAYRAQQAQAQQAPAQQGFAAPATAAGAQFPAQAQTQAQAQAQTQAQTQAQAQMLGRCTTSPAGPDEPTYTIDHSYTDYAAIPPSVVLRDYQEPTNTGGISQPFPQRLHALLSTMGMYDPSVLGWQEHGRCFVIRHPKDFARTTMVTYFKHRQFTSFQRQLNLYGFKRITKGPDKGAYYHALFLRGRPYLCLKMKRMKNKGVGKKPLPDPENEPDFYIMPYVGVPGEAQHDPHGVLPPGYNEVDSLLEKIRGNGKSAKGGRTNHLHPNPHAHQFPQHPQFQHPLANPNQPLGQHFSPDVLKNGIAMHQAQAASFAAAAAQAQGVPVPVPPPGGGARQHLSPQQQQQMQQPTSMELQLQQQMQMQQMQMQQMQTQLNQYQQAQQAQQTVSPSSQMMHGIPTTANGIAMQAQLNQYQQMQQMPQMVPPTANGITGGYPGYPPASAPAPLAAAAGYGGGLPGYPPAPVPYAGGVSPHAAHAPGSLLPPGLARHISPPGLARHISPAAGAAPWMGAAPYGAPPSHLQSAVTPTTLARMGSGTGAGASLSSHLARMGSGMGSAASAAPASSLPPSATTTLQVQAQQTQLQQLQAQRARLEQQMIMTNVAADQARAEANAAFQASRPPPQPNQGTGQTTNLLRNRSLSEQIATIQASATQPTATAVAVNAAAVLLPAKLKTGASGSTDSGRPADGDIVNTPVMHDLLAKQQALLLHELEQEKKNLEVEKSGKSASAVNKAKAAAAALGISLGSKAGDAAGDVAEVAAAANGVAPVQQQQQQQQQQGPPISSISIPQAPTTQQQGGEASHQAAPTVAAPPATTTATTEAFPTGRTGAAAPTAAVQPFEGEAAVMTSPPTYERAMDMKEDSMIAKQQAEKMIAASNAAAAAASPSQEQDADMGSIHSQMGSIGISTNNDDSKGAPTAEVENMDQVKRKRGIRFRRSSNATSSLSGKSKDESAADGSATSAGPQKKKGRMGRLLSFGKSKAAASTNGTPGAAPSEPMDAAAAVAGEDEDPVDLKEIQGGVQDMTDPMTESVDIDTIFSSKKSGESAAERAILESKS